MRVTDRLSLVAAASTSWLARHPLPCALLLGPMVGCLGSAAYGLLCGALQGLLRGRADVVLPWVGWFAVAGAGAGAIVGMCLAVDGWSSAAAAEPSGEDTTDPVGLPATDGRGRAQGWQAG